YINVDAKNIFYSDSDSDSDSDSFENNPSLSLHLNSVHRPSTSTAISCCSFAFTPPSRSNSHTRNSFIFPWSTEESKIRIRMGILPIKMLRAYVAKIFWMGFPLIFAVPPPFDKTKWKRKSAVTLALTFLTSSQAILIVWSKRAGRYEYSVTTANFLVEALKCALSLAALARIWRTEGVTDDNRLSTTVDEVSVYPIPAALYLVKNLLQYYIFAYVDAPGYQILKNLNIISTGVLYRIILKKKLSEIQWAAFILLCAGCTTAQLNPSSDHVLQTPFIGWLMAIIMALLSGFAGVYTEVKGVYCFLAIIKKRPSRNINVQNFWLYVFGMAFNVVAILIQDFDAVVNKGFFHGYSLITVLMIINHALSGIAVSMVMKYADNIVKFYLQVYSTSVAMLVTAVVSVFLFNFHLSLAFFLGSTVVSVSIYLHSIGKLQR
ncbi:Nucleotide-sugar transporter, partial [Cynara cardunculus var. scolymus]